MSKSQRAWDCSTHDVQPTIRQPDDRVRNGDGKGDCIQILGAHTVVWSRIQADPLENSGAVPTPRDLFVEALNTALRGAPYIRRDTIAPSAGTTVSRMKFTISVIGQSSSYLL